MSIYTDGTYYKNNPTWDLEHSSFKARYVAQLLRRNSIIPNNILDIGCGVGGVLFEMSKIYSHANLTGYDVSPQAIHEGKKMFGNKITFISVDPASSNNSYDLTMALDVIEHIEDYFTLMKEMKNLSENKIFHIPLEINLRWVLRPNLFSGANAKNGHIHFFNKESAMCALKWAGLEVLDYTLTPHAIELASSAKAKVAAIPRRAMSIISPEIATRVFGGWSLLVLAK
ncbi:class I SAM-dependent methyltransferase [Methyloglobulus sp.]|uniref:class I SAM-dependent methyltransferase n=1 Tax=Methyloglobulus sp. TaxID=2518622 RepID=UPI0032B85CE9